MIATKFGMPVDDEREGGAKPGVHPAASTTACAGSAPTASTSTSCTCPTPTRRSTRRSARSTSCARGQGARDRLQQLLGRADRATPSAARRDGARGSSASRTSTACCGREPEREVLPEASGHGLAFIPYFPLASGVLTGKYRAARLRRQGTRLPRPTRRGEATPVGGRSLARSTASPPGAGSEAVPCPTSPSGRSRSGRSPR